MLERWACRRGLLGSLASCRGAAAHLNLAPRPGSSDSLRETHPSHLSAELGRRRSALGLSCGLPRRQRVRSFFALRTMCPPTAAPTVPRRGHAAGSRSHRRLSLACHPPHHQLSTATPALHGLPLSATPKRHDRHRLISSPVSGPLCLPHSSAAASAFGCERKRRRRTSGRASECASLPTREVPAPARGGPGAMRLAASLVCAVTNDGELPSGVQHLPVRHVLLVVCPRR